MSQKEFEEINRDYELYLKFDEYIRKKDYKEAFFTFKVSPGLIDFVSYEKISYFYDKLSKKVGEKEAQEFKTRASQMLERILSNEEIANLFNGSKI